MGMQHPADRCCMKFWGVLHEVLRWDKNFEEVLVIATIIITIDSVGCGFLWIFGLSSAVHWTCDLWGDDEESQETVCSLGDRGKICMWCPSTSKCVSLVCDDVYQVCPGYEGSCTEESSWEVVHSGFILSGAITMEVIVLLVPFLVFLPCLWYLIEKNSWKATMGASILWFLCNWSMLFIYAIWVDEADELGVSTMIVGMIFLKDGVMVINEISEELEHSEDQSKYKRGLNYCAAASVIGISIITVASLIPMLAYPHGDIYVINIVTLLITILEILHYILSFSSWRIPSPIEDICDVNAAPLAVRLIQPLIWTACLGLSIYSIVCAHSDYILAHNLHMTVALLLLVQFGFQALCLIQKNQKPEMTEADQLRSREH